MNYVNISLYVDFSSKGLKVGEELEGRGRHLGASTQLAAFCKI